MKTTPQSNDNISLDFFKLKEFNKYSESEKPLIDQRKGYNLKEYIHPTIDKGKVKTIPFGCLDIETYTLENGIQRAYYVLIYSPSRFYKHIRRCDYLTEEQFNCEIIKYFKSNPSIYFTFNGKSFDHLLINRILNKSDVKT